ncbi:Mss4-like protein [Poronia punctata]|nr:Mss4-like protein [Poronia punctata]
MPEGSCVCGKIRYSYEGEPSVKALCHCADCRKISGSAFSTNILVSAEGFKVLSGTPKEYHKIADSGKPIVSFFCGDCGSTMWRDAEVFGNNKIIKAGTLDDPDALNIHKPAAELYTQSRIKWVQEVEGAAQKIAM